MFKKILFGVLKAGLWATVGVTVIGGLVLFSMCAADDSAWRSRRFS